MLKNQGDKPIQNPSDYLGTVKGFMLLLPFAILFWGSVIAILIWILNQ
jgi:hypothetical protein